MQLLLVFIEFWIPVVEDFATLTAKKGQILKDTDCFVNWNETIDYVEILEPILWNKV